MPYHIRITPKSSRDRDEVRLDLTKEQLEDRYVIPYRESRPIVISGKTILPEDIERIRITYTDQTSQELLPIIIEERRSSKVVAIGLSDEWEIAHRGKDITDDLITIPPLHVTSSAKKQPSKIKDSRKVLVVHGRNLKARDALFDFLRSIDLSPVEWPQAVKATGKGSPYIGEILDKAFSIAQAVIVLMTPDDEARLRKSFREKDDNVHEIEFTPQPRQNVLFEAGMAMGRSDDRTIIVELGNLRPFSDILGRHVVRLNNTPEKRQELAQRLKSAGCQVDVSGTDWHRTGDFTAPIEIQTPETYLSRTESFAALIFDKKGVYHRGQYVVFETHYRGRLTNGFFTNEIFTPQNQSFPNGKKSIWHWAPETLKDGYMGTPGELNGFIDKRARWSWKVPDYAPSGEYKVFMRVFNHYGGMNRHVIAESEDAFFIS